MLAGSVPNLPTSDKLRALQLAETRSGIPAAHEDEGFRLIGQLIVSWSRVHEMIGSQIGMMQRHIRVRQIRAGGSYLTNPGKHAYHVPEKRFKTRNRYYRILVRALADGQHDLVADAEAVVSNISKLYEARNDFVHSSILISSRWDPPAFRLTPQEWEYDFNKSLNARMAKIEAGQLRNLGKPPKPPKPKTYSFNEVRGIIFEMQSVVGSIEKIHHRLSVDGPVVEFPEPPA